MGGLNGRKHTPHSRTSASPMVTFTARPTGTFGAGAATAVLPVSPWTSEMWALLSAIPIYILFVEQILASLLDFKSSDVRLIYSLCDSGEALRLASHVNFQFETHLLTVTVGARLGWSFQALVLYYCDLINFSDSHSCLFKFHTLFLLDFPKVSRRSIF